ncbi:MAG TPA: hypothetical protein VGQ28_02595, partial [Thermoanaerobaculia bacterium]|nr:hypothetical protein [Thermoanaerobaculia bacterium]
MSVEDNDPPREYGWRGAGLQWGMDCLLFRLNRQVFWLSRQVFAPARKCQMRIYLEQAQVPGYAANGFASPPS